MKQGWMVTIVHKESSIWHWIF